MTIYEILQEAKRQWGAETVEAIKLKINDGDIIWQSTLLNSIRFEQDGTLDGEIEFKMTEYGKFIDEGVNGTSTSVGSQFSFRGKWKGTAEAIKPWADSKGINPYAVAKSIQKEGIKPRRFFNSVIESRLPDLATNLEVAYTTYLNETINKASGG
jgi:hypothetical protein